MKSDEFNSLKAAIEKLCLNDSSVSIANDSSPALGQGYRLGFLGLLHMDVFSERLMKEFNQESIVTAPNLPYRVKLYEDGTKKIQETEILILNPCHVYYFI